MTLDVTVIILLAALLHAGWNALVKIQGERLVAMASITLFGSMFSLLLVPFVDFPDAASWPWLIATIILHTAYHLFLPIAYDHGDLGQVYPIARGSAPLLVAIGAFVFAGEHLTWLGIVGVLCLASGVMALTFERGAGLWSKPKAITYALITGVMIASYTVVDGLGVREAGSVFGFAVWLTLGDGLLTFLIVFLLKGRKTIIAAKHNLRIGFLGGIMQVAAYWIIVWALASAPMATVSALRETSVIFAAIISTFILREGFGVWRFISAGLVTLGLIATRAGR